MPILHLAFISVVNNFIYANQDGVGCHQFKYPEKDLHLTAMH